MEGSVADLLPTTYYLLTTRSATDPSIIPLSEEGVTHRNVGDYYCHLSRHPFVSQIKYIIQEYGDRNWSNRPQSASDARADDDGRSNRPTPTHRFCHSAIFHPITPYNVWFFWVSRHRSIILAKKMETFSGRFWEIPGNVRKLEWSKTLVDHKNGLVFYQTVSGKSSWSFSHRWTQYQ